MSNFQLLLFGISTVFYISGGDTKAMVPAATLTTAPPPTITTVPPSASTTANGTSVGSLSASNNKNTTTAVPPVIPAAANGTIPSKEVGCDIFFSCKKVLEEAEAPKPCIKYCLSRIVCDNGSTHKGGPDECLDLDVVLVKQEYLEQMNSNGPVTIKPPSLSEVSCEPGYLPDSKGTCHKAQ